MTTLVLNYSSSMFDAIGKFFRGILVAFMYARQLSANHEAAQYLARHEYNKGEFQKILYELNSETHKYYKEKFNA